MNVLYKFAADEAGATAIEYGLLAAGISLAIVAALTAVSGQIGATFNTLASTLANAGK